MVVLRGGAVSYERGILIMDALSEEGQVMGLSEEGHSGTHSLDPRNRTTIGP